MKKISKFPMRLQVYIANATELSRRKAEEAVFASRVRVNEKIVKTLPFFVEQKDKVSLDFEELSIDNRFFVYALNKPKGAVCSNYDPHETCYAKDFLKVNDDVRKKLFSVGRLDKDSTGLILFTNDGKLANKIIHPSSSIVKTYFVMTDRAIIIKDLLKMTDGIKLEDNCIPYKIKSFKIKSTYSALLELESGKNREIRKLFEYFAYKIIKLVRLKIGQLELADLKEGESRKLSAEDIDLIFKP